MNDYLALALGVVCAGVGGELFVRGTVALAGWLRIAPGIVGATVAAFATSSPEFAVSTTAAISGKPQIALGDVLGSNVVNIALLLGIALCFSGISCSKGSLKRDLPLALIAPILTGLLILDGVLSRLDGAALLLVFFGWCTATILEVRRQQSAAGDVLGTHHPNRIALLCIAGLVFLIAAGSLIVTGARGIGLAFGIPEFVIGATVVALGTSTPELATILIAKFRGHDEVGLGTVLGSNIFNGFAILGTAAMICPIAVELTPVMVALGFGIAALIFTFPSGDGYLSRRRGIVLLCLYAVYVLAVLQMAEGPEGNSEVLGMANDPAAKL
jgi:cation:H+ antiporter